MVLTSAEFEINIGARKYCGNQLGATKDCANLVRHVDSCIKWCVKFLCKSELVGASNSCAVVSFFEISESGCHLFNSDLSRCHKKNFERITPGNQIKSK